MSQPESQTWPEREGGLERRLSQGQLSMIAIGGAIGTGLFLGSGFAISFAGPAVLVSYAIGAAIALLLMGCLAEMTVAHPTAGSFGAWAEWYVSPLAGFLVRWAYWSAIVMAVGTEVTAIAVYMRYWLPDVAGWVWILLFSVVLVAVNAVEVGWFGRVEYVFSAVKVAAIVAFVALGVWGVRDFSAFTAHGGFWPRGAWGMWVAVIVSIFSYLSIEMIAVAAGEAADPRASIVRAFRATVVRLVVFYLLTLALIVALAPWTEAGRGESPFVGVMARSGVPGAAGVVNLVVLVAALSAMNSQLYVAARMMFSLARAGQAPAALGRLSASGVPVRALGLSSLGIALAAVVYVVWPRESFTIMMAVSMFGAMFTWMMIFVTHLFFRRRQAGELVFRMWGYPWTSALGALAMAAVMATTAFTAEFRMTLVYGAVLLVGLVVGWRFCKPV